MRMSKKNVKMNDKAEAKLHNKHKVFYKSTQSISNIRWLIVEYNFQLFYFEIYFSSDVLFTKQFSSFNWIKGDNEINKKIYNYDILKKSMTNKDENIKTNTISSIIIMQNSNIINNNNNVY